jgi:hypothetical protein
VAEFMGKNVGEEPIEAQVPLRRGRKHDS